MIAGMKEIELITVVARDDDLAGIAWNLVGKSQISLYRAGLTSPSLHKNLIVSTGVDI